MQDLGSRGTSAKSRPSKTENQDRRAYPYPPVTDDKGGYMPVRTANNVAFFDRLHGRSSVPDKV